MKSSVVQILVCLVFVSLLASVGCRNRLPETDPLRAGARQFANPRMQPNSVILKIAVVEIKGDEIEEFSQMWSSLDAQAVSLDQRKQLDRNGLQAAIAGLQLPSQLTSLLEPDTSELGKAEDSLDAQAARQLAYRFRFIEHQRHQMLPNENHWVGCSVQHPELFWTVSNQDQTRSGVCQQANCGFLLNVEPQGDGGVQLHLEPEIRYGERRNRYRVQEDSFVIREESESARLKELMLSVTLRPGETLLVAPTDQAEGLGGDFFVVPAEISRRRFLMVRLLHTQKDDLFVPRSTRRPLATSTL